MYDKKLINELAEKYVKTSDETVFEALIDALIPLINVQLGKNYSNLKEFWEDMVQDVIVRLLKRRKNLKTTKTRIFYQYFYNRIRDDLWRIARDVRAQYDTTNPNVVQGRDLSQQEGESAGELIDDDFDDGGGTDFDEADWSRVSRIFEDTRYKDE